jgi:hypothetical protein
VVGFKWPGHALTRQKFFFCIDYLARFFLFFCFFFIKAPLRLRQFWTHFWLFWHHFDVFFRSCFSTWFRDRFFMLSASVLTSFSHHFQIIFASVFVSLENVISETPTREINGFAFWNVVRNMI